MTPRRGSNNDVINSALSELSLYIGISPSPPAGHLGDLPRYEITPDDDLSFE